MKKDMELVSKAIGPHPASPVSGRGGLFSEPAALFSHSGRRAGDGGGLTLISTGCPWNNHLHWIPGPHPASPASGRGVLFYGQAAPFSQNGRRAGDEGRVTLISTGCPWNNHQRWINGPHPASPASERGVIFWAGDERTHVPMGNHNLGMAQ